MATDSSFVGGPLGGAAGLSAEAGSVADSFPYPLPDEACRIVLCHRCQGRNRVLLLRAFEQPDKLRCGRCQQALFVGRDAPLRGLQGKLYQHPLDQQSLATLESVPGVSTLLRKLVEATVERYDALFNESSFVRVGGSQLPTIERLFERAAYALDIRELPALYVYQGSEANAFTGGVEAPYIALTSALIDGMSDEEVMAVLAHELAHMQSRHVLYKMAARLLGFAAAELAKVTLGMGGLVMVPLQLALLSWDRCSELTADRGMLLAVRDPAVALRVLMKLAGGSARLGRELSLDRFMEQALRARRAGDEDVMSRVFTLLQTAWRSHPFPLWRAAELWRWACQGEYLSLLQSAAA
jgi:Zn-dependent protease with chaperone function